MGTGLAVVPVAFEVPVETGPANAENLRCAQAVAVAHLKDFLDVTLAHLFQ